MSDSTTKLWDEVCTTDPKHTKKVQQKGGFTAICAQYQIHKATEQWGPYGGAWGVKDCRYEYVRDAKGEVLEGTLEAVFYCPSGEFELSTDATFRVGGDTRKKLLTDLTTKALSKLGFNADVFLGQYDDSKYVQEQRRAHAGNDPQASRTAPQPPRTTTSAPPPQGAPSGSQAPGNDPWPDWPIPRCPICKGPGKRRERATGRQPSFQCAGDCTEHNNGRDWPKSYWRPTEKQLKAAKAKMREVAEATGKDADGLKDWLHEETGVPRSAREWNGDDASGALDWLSEAGNTDPTQAPMPPADDPDDDIPF